MSLLLREFDLLEPLRPDWPRHAGAYGSCAGMILLASEILDAGEPGRQAEPLGAIDMTVRRNAFGRQVDSFEGDIEFEGSTRRRTRSSSGRPGSNARRARTCGCWPAPTTTSWRYARRCWPPRFTPR